VTKPGHISLKEDLSEDFDNDVYLGVTKERRISESEAAPISTKSYKRKVDELLTDENREDPVRRRKLARFHKLYEHHNIQTPRVKRWSSVPLLMADPWEVARLRRDKAECC